MNQETFIAILVANMITFLLLYFMLKPGGRKAPTAVVNDGLRLFYLAYLKQSKKYYFLEEIEGKDIFYTDWDRGIGYGWMEKPFRLGDQILVKADKNRYHILVVYRTIHPSESEPGFFHFKTFYLRTVHVRKLKRKPPSDPELESFQRYD